MLDRAERRGELRADLDEELFMDSLLGLLFARIVFMHQRVDEAFVQRFLDDLMTIASRR